MNFIYCPKCGQKGAVQIMYSKEFTTNYAGLAEKLRTFIAQEVK